MLSTTAFWPFLGALHSDAFNAACAVCGGPVAVCNGCGERQDEEAQRLRLIAAGALPASRAESAPPPSRGSDD